MTAKPLSVLIIDDNPRLVDDYAHFLELHGVVVYTAVSGPDGIQQAKRVAPKVILLDLMLPGMDGIETLKKLKDDEATKEIPVIVITALVEDQEKDASLKNGADAYIAKIDTTPDKLLETIRSHAATSED